MSLLEAQSRVRLLLAACLSIWGGAAQTLDGGLTGRVADATGQGIPQARVQAVHQSTNVTLALDTDSTGQYLFTHLPTGAWRVEASANGFQPYAYRNVAIELNRTATLNFTLAVGPLPLTLEVVDSSAIIDTTSARVQTGFTQRQVTQLPITSAGNLGVLNLSLLSAGVSSSGGVGYGVGPSLGGQRPTNNNFTIDGIDNNDRNVTGPVLRISNEAIAELSLQQNQYSPEFGHSSGGQFNLITRSGTNAFRGSAFLYHQNRLLNAVDESYARQGIRQSPRFDQNRFGATGGGAFIRDKLFWFGSFENRPLGMASVSNGGIYAPTAEGLQTLDNLSGLSRTNLEQFKKWVPIAANASRAITVAGVDIPVGLIQTQAPSYENFRNGLASLDYVASERDQLRFRYLQQASDGPETRVDLPAFFTPYSDGARLASLTHHHLFTPSTTHELRLGWLRRAEDNPSTQLSFPGLDAFPNINFADLGLEIGPYIALPQAARSSVYQLSSNFTHVRGRATWKLGYDARKLDSSVFFTQLIRGYYQYQTLERYLLDLSPEQAERSTGGTAFPGDLFSHYFYANNDWRLRRNLTINLGLRYEYAGVPAGVRLQSANAQANVPGLIDFRAPRASKTDFMPRLGLAWSPGSSGRTSLRAGFGMNYDQLYQNLGIVALPPQFFTTISLDTTQTPKPGFLSGGGIPPDSRPPAMTPAAARAATAAYIPDQQRPYSLQWNAGIQRVLKRDYTLELRYLGSRGVHLPVQTRLNRQAAVTSSERSLPLFFTRPSAAQLDSLPLTRDDLKAPVTPLQAAGFTGNVTAISPIGNSLYHGFAAQLDKRFAHGFLATTAYTWSHNIDDSTAVLNSTVLTPRRPEDFFNLRRERASSALDHRHRFTQAWYWETPWAKQASPLLRILLADWTLAGAVMAETGSWATPRSGADSNLNGDAAGDRTFINPLGDRRIASAVAPLCRSAVLPIECSQKKPPKQLVGYLVMNPDARYIQAAEGVAANGGRNTFRLPGIHNWDVSVGKRVRFTDQRLLEFRAEAYNAFNHAQFTAGFPNLANGRQRIGLSDQLLMQASSPVFGRADQAFQSNSRNVQLVLRLTF